MRILHGTGQRSNIEQVALYGLLLFGISSMISIAAASIFLYAALLATIVAYWKQNERWREAISATPLKVIGIFLAVLFFTALFSYDVRFSMSRCIAVTTRFLPFLLILVLKPTKTELLMLTGATGISLLLSDAAAYWQWFVGYDRVKGFTGHPIVFGIQVLQVSALLLPTALQRNHPYPSFRFFAQACVVASAPALLLTGARGVWIAAAGAMLILGGKRRNMMFAITVLAIFLVVLSWSTTLQQRIMSIADMQNQSNSERLLMWNSAWQMWKDHPLAGVGLGMYQDLEKSRYISPLAKDPNNRLHAHSNYMTLLAETGTVGVAGFVILLGYFTSYFANVYRKSSHNGYAMAGLLLMGTFWLHGLTEYSFGHLPVLRLWAYSLGICVMGMCEERQVLEK